MTRLAFTITLALAGAGALAAQTAPNACGLLTTEEAKTLIVRGQNPIIPLNAEASSVVGGKGSVCDYNYGGQVAIYVGPNSEAAFEQFLKAFNAQGEPKTPVPGVGDKAYVIYPKPRNEYSDQGPYLVATVGPHTVTAFLARHKGNADGPMGEMCRSGKMSAKDAKDCPKILADKTEAPESLLPAVTELAKAVVAKVRAGKF
jgi:hypothetical protein